MAGMGILGGLAAGIGSQFMNKAFGTEKENAYRSFDFQKQLMGLQATYNKQQAQYSQQLAKELWDYTSYGNQKKNLIQNGLNPALLYGQSGGGGIGQTNGGKAEGVGMPSGNPIGIGLQAKAIEAQNKQATADLISASSNAKLAEAQAEKTSGVDTEKAYAEINNMVKQGNLYEAQTALTNREEDYTQELITKTVTDVKMTNVEITKVRTEIQNNLQAFKGLVEDFKNKEMNNRLLRATIDDQIENVSLQNACLVAQTFKLQTGAQFDEATIQKIAQEIQLMPRETKAREKEVAAMAQRLAQQTGIDYKNLDLKEIQMMIDGASKGINGLIDMVKTFAIKRR